MTAEGIPSFLVSSSLDKSVRVWTSNGKKTIYECQADLALGSEVHQLAMHPSHTLVASVHGDGSFAIHDLVGDKPRTVLTASLPDDAAPGTGNTAVAFHPDGVLFGVGSSDSRIRIFETLTGRLAASFDGHAGESDAVKEVVSLSFSENGYLFASAAQGSKQVKIWDLRKLVNSAKIDLGAGDEGAGAGASAVAFDYSAQFLAVVGQDARVYQNKTWELLAKNDDNAAELTSVQWGKDSRELAVAGIDRTVRFLSRPE